MIVHRISGERKSGRLPGCTHHTRGMEPRLCRCCNPCGCRMVNAARLVSHFDKCPDDYNVLTVCDEPVPATGELEGVAKEMAAMRRRARQAIASQLKFTLARVPIQGGWYVRHAAT